MVSARQEIQLSNESTIMRKIDIDQGHSSCQRCLELRLKDSKLRNKSEYFQLCNTHFEIIVRGVDK